MRPLIYCTDGPLVTEAIGLLEALDLKALRSVEFDPESVALAENMLGCARGLMHTMSPAARQWVTEYCEELRLTDLAAELRRFDPKNPDTWAYTALIAIDPQALGFRP